ncbi:hypothetical protein CR513_52728, partial [Mucuna pruriens]
MNDFGMRKEIHSMEIIQNRKVRRLCLSRKRYIEKVLKRFRIQNAKVVEEEFMSQAPYFNMVGSFMYAIFCTRLNIVHSMSVVSHYIANLGKDNRQVTKWIYLRCLTKEQMMLLIMLLDFVIQTMQVVLILACYIIIYYCLVNHRSKVYGTKGVKETKWLKYLVGDHGKNKKDIIVFCDRPIVKAQLIKPRIICIMKGDVLVEKIVTFTNPTNIMRY